MRIDLRYIPTDDGLVHQAHFYPPDADGPLRGSRLGMLVVHGSTGECGNAWIRAYAERFSRFGLPVLCANNRGHHVVGRGRPARGTSATPSSGSTAASPT